MERLTLTKPFKVKAIYFKGGIPIHNCTAYIAGNFLIAGQDEEDNKPVWYNIDTIYKMEGVEPLPDTPRQGRAGFF